MLRRQVLMRLAAAAYAGWTHKRERAIGPHLLYLIE
jgi:hypothetical protein